MDELNQALQELLAIKQNALEFYSATLGNGQGVVWVPDLPTHVYIRIGDQVTWVRNNRLNVNIDGFPVFVGKLPEEPTITQVLSVDTARLAALGLGNQAVNAHARTHELNNPEGGTDVVYIQGMQFLPGRLGPVSSSVAVTVYPIVCWINGAYRYIGRTTLDLSSYVPAISGKIAMVLITVDQAGTLVTTKGAEVDILALAPLTDTPGPPTGTALILGAVKVYHGQTGTVQGRQNWDILDLRFFQQGGGGGSGDMTKAVYDTDNDGIVDRSEAVDGVATAGASKYYGTNSASAPGFYELPTGGGGGSSYFDPQTPPPLPNAIDDEFNGTISDQWSWSAAPNSVNVNQLHGWLLVELAAAASYQLRRDFVPGANTAFGFETMLSFPGSINADEMGIALLDSSNVQIANFSTFLFEGIHRFRSTAPNNPVFNILGTTIVVNGDIEFAIGSEWELVGVERISGLSHQGSWAFRGTHQAPTTTQYARFARQTMAITAASLGRYTLSAFLRRVPVDTDNGTASRVRCRMVDPDSVTVFESDIISSPTWVHVTTGINVNKTGNWVFWYTPFATGGSGWTASRGMCDTVSFIPENFHPSPLANHLWLRIHRDASNIYRYWWSTDGVTWKLIYTSAAVTGIVAKVALLFSQSVTTTRTYGVNYIRRYA